MELNAAANDCHESVALLRPYFSLIVEYPMKACLSFDEVLALGQPQLLEMQRVGDAYPSADVPGACAAFSRQTRVVEGVVTQTYAIAASLARKAEDLNEVAEIWRRTGEFCQSALQRLTKLKDKYPKCGAPELYDLVLDYKLACDKRHKGVMEEQACLTMDFPKGLLPNLK